MSLDGLILNAELLAFRDAMTAAGIHNTIFQVDGENAVDNTMTRHVAIKIIGKLIRGNSVFRQAGDANENLTLSKLSRLRTGDDDDRIALLRHLDDIDTDPHHADLKQRILNLAPQARSWVLEYRRLLKWRRKLANERRKIAAEGDPPERLAKWDASLSLWQSRQVTMLLAIENNQEIT